MSIWKIIIACLAVGGIYWGYPKLPYPANIILVIIVVFVCLIILLDIAGIQTGLHF